MLCDTFPFKLDVAVDLTRLMTSCAVSAVAAEACGYVVQRFVKFKLYRITKLNVIGYCHSSTE